MDKSILEILNNFLSLKPPVDDEEVGLHTFTIGVIYSYSRLKQLNYDESLWDSRVWQVRYEEVVQTTKELMNGNTITNNQWLAEYYYNNLIYRLDVAFERIQNRVFNIKRKSLDELGFKQEWSKAWSDVRNLESNPIKHKSPERLRSPQRLSVMKLQNVIFCLIDAIEWVQSQK